MMKLVHLNKRFEHSVREVRDSLMKLERNLKHAIKLKNEQEWIQEHITNMLRIVFPKIQEKLIKMAKRIGELKREYI